MTETEIRNRKHQLRRRAAKLGYLIAFTADRARVLRPQAAGLPPVPCIAGLIDDVAVYLDAQARAATGQGVA